MGSLQALLAFAHVAGQQDDGVHTLGNEVVDGVVTAQNVGGHVVDVGTAVGSDLFFQNLTGIAGENGGRAEGGYADHEGVVFPPVFVAAGNQRQGHNQRENKGQGSFHLLFPPNLYFGRALYRTSA